VQLTATLHAMLPGPEHVHPLGRHGGMHIFDWYTSGPDEGNPLFHAAPGASQDEVDRMFADFISYYSEHIADRSRPFPGLDAALARLATRGRHVRLD